MRKVYIKSYAIENNIPNKINEIDVVILPTIQECIWYIVKYMLATNTIDMSEAESLFNELSMNNIIPNKTNFITKLIGNGFNSEFFIR